MSVVWILQGRLTDGLLGKIIILYLSFNFYHSGQHPGDHMSTFRSINGTTIFPSEASGEV